MLITNQRETEQICSFFAKEPFICLDTEFLWTKTYFAVPSLLQIASPSKSCAIDLTILKNYQSIKELLKTPIPKVFHSAKQDLLLLKRLTGIEISHIFDSQIATAFLNIDFQISYNALIKHFCNVELAKSPPHLNWLKRPLTQAQIKYALNDVIYLAKVYPILKKQLELSDKSGWFKEEMQNCYSKSFYSKKVPPNHQAVKGWQNVSSHQLITLEYLAKLRDQIAQEVDMRPNFIIHDSVLIYLSHKKNISPEIIKTLYMDKKIKNTYQDKIIQTWQDSKKAPPSQHPKLPQRISYSTFFYKAETQIKKLVNKKAKDYNINPTFLLPRTLQHKVIKLYEKNKPFSSCLNPWRHKLLNRDLQQLLSKTYV